MARKVFIEVKAAKNSNGHAGWNPGSPSHEGHQTSRRPPVDLMEKSMTRKDEVSCELVRAMFDYDPNTGFLLHRKSRGNARRGERAGSLKPTGYRVINVGGRWFQSARVVWLHQYGRWPEHCVDHMNHIRDDDRLENLRDVTAQENSHNLSGRRINNRSGTVGVTWNSRSKKWYATINVMRKSIFLGSHSSYEEAVAARKAGVQKYHQQV